VYDSPEQIGYSLIPMVASGQALGFNQPLELVLLDIPPCEGKLKGVCMEIQDCGFSLVTKIIPSVDGKTAFKDVNLAILVGGFPRRPGMLRADLLKKNSSIFSGMGKAIGETAAPDCKVVVVANPANTNCLIAAMNASNLPKENFSALTRLDYNRAKGQLLEKFNLNTTDDIKNVIIWGNHSKTQYPDVINAEIKKEGKWTPVLSVASEEDKKYLASDFITTVQQRGAAVLKARGFSSACSAANAVVNHVNSLYLGTKEGEHVAMAVWSNGNPYGIADGIFYSFPVTCKGGKWSIVGGIKNTEAGTKLMKATEAELLEERKVALGK